MRLALKVDLKNLSPWKDIQAYAGQHLMSICLQIIMLGSGTHEFEQRMRDSEGLYPNHFRYHHQLSCSGLGLITDAESMIVQTSIYRPLFEIESMDVTS